MKKKIILKLKIVCRINTDKYHYQDTIFLNYIL